MLEIPIKKENVTFKKLTDNAFSRHIVRIVSVPVVLIFLLLGYTHFQISYIDSISRKVQTLDKAILETVRFEKIVSDMGIGIRGYVMTGKKYLLDPYDSSIENAEKYKKKIFKLIGDDYNFAKSFRDSLIVFEDWKENSVKVIDIRSRRSRGSEQAAENLSLRNNQIFIQLGDELSHFEQVLQTAKVKRVRDLRDAKRMTEIFEAVYIFLLVLILVILLSREVRKATKSYRLILKDNLKNIEEIEKASKSKDLFLANMSHEIRTPLGAVVGFAELAYKEPSLTPEAKSYISFVMRNAEHLLSLIDDLFDISKITAEKLELSDDKVNIRQLLGDVKNTFSSKLNDKRVELKLSINKGVPYGAVTDETRLRQIVTNLIGNAVKFSPNHSTVEAIIAFKQGLLSIDVIDDGIGIDTSKHESIFQAFSQEDDSHSRDFGGAGLGLSISKKLANLLGGDVVLVSSQKSKGSHFRAFIEVESVFSRKECVDDTQDNAEELVVTKVTKVWDFSGKRILLAEDSKENQTLFKIYIESSGADLTIVENGTDAVKEILNESYDLGILDIQMPGLDGREAVNIIRNANYKKPIFALTAHTLKGEREKCLRSGFDDYLSKPVMKDKLMRTIAKYV